MNVFQIVGIIGLVIEVLGIHYATLRRRGWLIALAGAALWGVYAIGEWQWPAMLSTAIFGAAYFRHWWNSGRRVSGHS